jgi:integrase
MALGVHGETVGKMPRRWTQISDRRALCHLKTVLKQLKLEGHQHTFRHSFISHALTSGVPEAIVRKWVGHVDARIMKTYTHIADRISQNAMSGLFNPNGDEPRYDHRTVSVTSGRYAQFCAHT